MWAILHGSFPVSWVPDWDKGVSYLPGFCLKYSLWKDGQWVLLALPPPLAVLSIKPRSLCMLGKCSWVLESTLWTWANTNGCPSWSHLLIHPAAFSSAACLWGGFIWLLWKPRLQNQNGTKVPVGISWYWSLETIPRGIPGSSNPLARNWSQTQSCSRNNIRKTCTSKGGIWLGQGGSAAQMSCRAGGFLSP